jgi:hypothetical protein
MWGARGPFPPAAAMVVAVVTPVVFCAKATEKTNKNTKISWWLPINLFITIYCKRYWVTTKIGIKFIPPKLIIYLFQIYTNLAPLLV